MTARFTDYVEGKNSTQILSYDLNGKNFEVSLDFEDPQDNECADLVLYHFIKEIPYLQREQASNVALLDYNGTKKTKNLSWVDLNEALSDMEFAKELCPFDEGNFSKSKSERYYKGLGQSLAEKYGNDTELLESYLSAH